MKILFVLENYIPHIGGVEVLFKHLAEGFVKQGHNVSIITHRIKGTKKYEIIKSVKIHRISCFHSRYLFTFFSIPKVLKEAKRADVIYATIFNGAFPAWVSSKIRKKPVILNVNEVWKGLWKDLGEMSWLNAKLHEFLEKLIYLFKYDHYVCISKSTQNQLLKLGINKDKINLIYLGVDYKFFDPKKYNGEKIRKKHQLKGFVYLFYGRPGVSKGLEYLIKAVPIISKKIPNSKFIGIVSRNKADKKRNKYILKLIKKLNIQDKILLLKPVPRKELPNYIKAADCIVVPSLAEGFGLTTAESCAMDKPVVASNTGSIPEVISGRYVLVKPKSPEDIARGVELIYKKKIKRKRRRIFKWDNVIKNYLDVYKKIIAKKV